MSLLVLWAGQEVGRVETEGETSRDYRFRYTDRSRPISLSLPTTHPEFSPAESRPFFEGLLPEGTLREQIAQQLKLAAGDSFGLLAALGRDCAGALQVVESRRISESPDVRWLSPDELDELIADLPHRPLGIRSADARLRLSLAGVQRKAVLVRDHEGTFGEPLSGMPSTHIVKPDPTDSEFPALATNEYFCMRLAARCGLPTSNVELVQAAGRPCLVVERFDRDRSTAPVSRLHQEDLCQALGVTPDFKYQHAGWRLPSYAAVAELLDEHSVRPGADRLTLARAAVFNFLVGNSDAHARNFAVLHVDGGVELAPLYDVVSTSVYPDLNQDLALAIGDTFEPAEVSVGSWLDLAADLGLAPRGFEQVRTGLASSAVAAAEELLREARANEWHADVLDEVVATVAARAQQV